VTEMTGTHVPHDPSKDDCTVFVSNLDYTVSEEEVKNVLSKAGQITDFRLVRDFKGRSKGYGYCVFPSKVNVKHSRSPPFSLSLSLSCSLFLSFNHLISVDEIQAVILNFRKRLKKL